MVGYNLAAANHVDVTVNVSDAGAPLWTISPFLASISLVYSWNPDHIYGNSTFTNDTVREWAIDNGINTARYPAGEGGEQRVMTTHTHTHTFTQLGYSLQYHHRHDDVTSL